MISYLKGTIKKIDDKHLTIANDFIGYDVQSCPRIIDKHQLGTEIELLIYTRVREDEISLYGFETSDELQLFKHLISVNKVGPKLGIELLNLEINTLKQAITSKNIPFLSKVPGIGKKTAERICLDLQSKIAAPAETQTLPISDEKFEEAIDALLGLGYQRFEINRYLGKLPEKSHTTEEIITSFLQSR